MEQPNPVMRRLPWLLRDVLARIAFARESLDVGAIDEADRVLCDLEFDLERELLRVETHLREAA